MTATLELVEWNKDFPVRSFIDEGNFFVSHHWHREIEIIFAIEGNQKLGFGDTDIELKQGDFCIINSGEIHYFYPAPKSKRIVLQYDLTIFKELQFLKKAALDLADLLDGVPRISRAWSKPQQEKMTDILCKINDEFTYKPDGYEIAIRAELYRMLLLIYRELPRTEKKEGEHAKQKISVLKLKKVFAFVEKNYQHEISLNDVAEFIGFTPTYFTKFFKKHMGITFWAYLTGFRLTQAQLLLFHEDTPITEVAYSVGFSSIQTFNRTFKNELGVSPREFRKRQYLRS